MADSEKRVLELLGGEAGCRRLAKDFYARVATSPELHSLFPSKNLRCATEEFAAFLIQFLGGDPDQTQYRWWLGLRESHARFQISGDQRRAWLGLMNEAIESVVDDRAACREMGQFFEAASTYIMGGDAPVGNTELNERWNGQPVLDRLVDALRAGRDAEAIALTASLEAPKSVRVGILARMMETGREPLMQFVLDSVRNEEDLATSRFNGRTLLHHAAGCSCLPVVQNLLAAGVDPNILDNGGHAPLYRAASSSASPAPDVVRALVQAGAEVDYAGGVSRSTALHQAARFGNVAVAQALLQAGASPAIRDKKGLTSLDRARRCRRSEVAALLADRG